MDRPFPFNRISKVEEASPYPFLGRAVGHRIGQTYEAGHYMYNVTFQVYDTTELAMIERENCHLCDMPINSSTITSGGLGDMYEVKVAYSCNCVATHFAMVRLDKEWCTIKGRVMAL